MVTRGDAKIDNKKFKLNFQGKARMMSPDEVLEAAGHPVGGVCPFGLRQKMDIYKTKFWDPHEEMRGAYDAYNYNSLFQAAVNSLVKFIMGNEIRVVCKDELTRKFLQSHVENTDLEVAMTEVVENTIKSGNGYLEVDLNSRTGLPHKYYPIADSSRIYINANRYIWRSNKNNLQSYGKNTYNSYSYSRVYRLLVLFFFILNSCYNDPTEEDIRQEEYGDLYINLTAQFVDEFKTTRYIDWREIDTYNTITLAIGMLLILILIIEKRKKNSVKTK